MFTRLDIMLVLPKHRRPVQSVLTVLTHLVLLLAVVPGTYGHGRLIQPPSRSTAWRYGFPTPPNYNDHEIYCGGYARQWSTNGGKCGPCGDPWDSPQPRANEGGGKYGLGVITATYQEAAEIEIGIELTASHKGFFEFRICPNNNPKKPVSSACLDKHVLERSDGSGPKYYPVDSRKYYMRYSLPQGITCTQCVLQWRYVAGNNWGNCPNGTGMVGCGPQEEFRACADISITHSDGSADDLPLFPDEDYNEIDTSRLAGNTTQGDPDYVGHVVALSVAAVLLPLILLAVILYFKYAKGKVSKLAKKHVGLWNICKKEKLTPGEVTGGDKDCTKSNTLMSSSSATAPVPPQAPPRRNRYGGGMVSPTGHSSMSPSPSIPV